eukprot:TRINITY_DN116_c0_g1_i5.p1 TRINITY_DN116_c0_g1~~TRINITY_DN116_c0_g1_i5.p1  ORF type:complete len:109 (+),score=12.05 TRINITY_DN116_c0_g1_i5:361-687(+)
MSKIKNLPDRKIQSPETFFCQAVCRTGRFVSVRQGDLYMVTRATMSRPFLRPLDRDDVAAFLPNFRTVWLVSSRAARPVGPVLCVDTCLLYTSPSPRDRTRSRMPSSA